MKKNNKQRTPTLFRQIVAIHYEQAMQRKAMRNLAKLDWSVDFLASIVQRCKDDVVLTVKAPNGATMSISKQDAYNDIDNDILMRLDDEAAVQSFIAEHSRG